MKNVLYNYTFLYCHKGILFARIAIMSDDNSSSFLVFLNHS